MPKGHIYFICGVSGAGKGTVIQNIKQQKLSNIYFPLSCKTRKPRKFEKNGVDAIFMSRQKFEKAIENGEFIEYALVHGLEYYGTRISDIFNNGIEKGLIVIKEIDLIGLQKLEDTRKDLKPFYTTIFFDISDEEMVFRIKRRDETISDLELNERLASAKKEREWSKICDFKIDSSQSKDEVLRQTLNIINNQGKSI